MRNVGVMEKTDYRERGCCKTHDRLLAVPGATTDTISNIVIVKRYNRFDTTILFNIRWQFVATFAVALPLLYKHFLLMVANFLTQSVSAFPPVPRIRPADFSPGRPLRFKCCLPLLLSISTACTPPVAHRHPDAGEPQQAPVVRWSEYRVSHPLPSVEKAPSPSAAPNVRQRYDLPALIDMALQNHPETRLSWEDAKAAAARVEREAASWYPKLTALAFGQYFKTSIPIPQSTLVSTGVGTFGGAELAWTLFDFGRREALDEASLERFEAAQFGFGRKHQEIAYRVADSFFAYQAAIAKVAAAEQTFTAAKANAEAVNAKLSQGFATRPDLLLALQEQAKANYDWQDARGAVTQTRAALTTSAGLSPSVELSLIDLSQVPLPDTLAPSVEKIVDQALEQRPDLQAKLAELRAREAEVRKARAEYWPKLSLKGSIGNQYWGDVQTDPPSRRHYSSDNLVGSAMLNLEWNLFDGFERRGAVDEAEAKRRAGEAQIDRLRLEIMRHIWQTYADTKTALEKREFALALLRAAEESYAATQESYRHGFSTVIELLSAQKDLARARYTEIDSRADLLKSAAALVYAAGGGESP